MCDRPLRGFWKIGFDEKHRVVKLWTKNGKPDYWVCDQNVKYIWLDSNGKLHKSYDNSPNQFNSAVDVVKEFQPIPCGSCLSCRITRAAEMADRCMLEMEYHDKNCFVTLTYSDDKLITTNWVNVSSGEVGTSSTLFKKHYMDFFKRLRKNYPDNDVRYLLCGEYGENTGRPHYHAIIFGYRPTDLVFYKLNHRGQVLYVSPELEKIWNKGFVIVGDVTRDSCNYVARYVTKKLYGDYGKEEYQEKGRIPPFTISSKRPAIGKRWYEDNNSWCFEHQISYSTPEGGHSFNAPRYFKKLRERENGVRLSKYDYMDDVNSKIKYLLSVHESDYNNLRGDLISDAKERAREKQNKTFTRDAL